MIIERKTILFNANSPRVSIFEKEPLLSLFDKIALSAIFGCKRHRCLSKNECGIDILRKIHTKAYFPKIKQIKKPRFDKFDNGKHFDIK